MQTQTSYCLVLTTTAEEDQAIALAQKIVQEQLGACVQIQAIRSVYIWKNQSCNELEYQLQIKARTSQYRALEAFILKNHSYETPEIIQIPIAAGFGAYLQWIDDSTADTSPQP